jgi:flagellar basal body rod protein FlgC
MDPIAAARLGMMFATRKLEGAANQVAQFGLDSDVDLTGAMVDQIEAKTAFKANVQVVKIADEMWRSLLDIQTA